MTKLCNLKCSYCIQRNNEKKYKLTKDIIEKQEEELFFTAGKISSFLERTDFHNVRLDLVGGEISIFDLKKIISNIKSDRIKKIFITTNFMKDADYYQSLSYYLKGRHIGMTITASFHYEFQNIDTYFSKLACLKKTGLQLTAEIVATTENKELCKEFKKRAENLGINYSIDGDNRSEFAYTRDNVIVDNEKKRCWRHVIFSDGTDRIYHTRSEFLSDKNIAEIDNNTRVLSHGFYCTHTKNFFYINYNVAEGRTENSTSCKNVIDIDALKPIENCSLCREQTCSLCYPVSLTRNN